METILTNNGMSNEEFKLFCLNYQSTKTQKEIDFTDFTCFILNTSIHNGEDMGFLKADEYHDGNFDNCQYSLDGENDVWDRLQELVGCDYGTMEDEFKSVRWEDNNNTAIISFEGDSKEYTILRM